MNLRILIVEDEHLGMERLERQLNSLGKDIEVVGLADSVSSSVEWLKTNVAPHLIMMDIDLGDGQSFEIFNQVPIRSHVIFTTSYDEHALHAFQSNNIDYLLKPIRKTELEQSISKYLSSDLFGITELNEMGELVRSLRRQLNTNIRQRFLGKDGKKLVSIETTDIRYFFSEDERSFLRTRDKKKLQVDHTMDEIEFSVDRLDYFRVNDRWILGISSVSKTNIHANGSMSVQLRPVTEKPVIVDPDKIATFRTWIKRKD